MQDDNFFAVCDIGLEFLSDQVLDISSAASPKRFRFVDCVAFIDRKVLHICESLQLPTFPYSAVSYVWRGNQVDTAILQNHKTFQVKGPEDGDPINIDVLRRACLTSIRKGSSYLWIDRLCILQDNEEDKRWQISYMHSIYQNCKPCIILPAGVQCIVPLDVETAWVHRSWTLQESLAPEDALVLFSWDHGPGEVKTADEFGIVEEIVPSETAITNLAAIVNACVIGNLEFQSSPARWDEVTGQIMRCKILGHGTPNLLSLGVTLNETLAADPDARDHAVWQCALMRTSKRPIDMVFSIMGLFGVSLDTSAFGKNERLRATIALAREILSKGGRACWLGMSLDLSLSRHISTFPEFPQTSVAGKALVETKIGKQEVAQMMEGQYPVEYGLGTPLPHGSMDSAGYLTVECRTAHAIQLPVTKSPGSSAEACSERPGFSGSHGASMLLKLSAEAGHLSSNSLLISQVLQISDDNDEIVVQLADGTNFKLCQKSEGVDSTASGGVLAVIFGWFIKYYPGASPANDRRNIRGMLIKEHANGKFHVISFFSLDRKWREWTKSLDRRIVCVGGPEALEQNE